MTKYTPRRRHARGAQAEEHAERFLRSQGLLLIGRNYNCRFGEIDLIMRDKTHLVFVEVRYRRSSAFGGALGSIERHKRERLVRTAQHYLAYEARNIDTPCRFDVVALSTAHFGTQWVKNAFSLSD